MQNTLLKKRKKIKTNTTTGGKRVPKSYLEILQLSINIEHFIISWERALTIMVNGYATYKQGKNQHQAPEGLEPPAFCLLGRRSANWAIEPSGDYGRTVDLMSM